MSKYNELLAKVSHDLAAESRHDADVLLFGLRLLIAGVSGFLLIIIPAALLGVLPYSLIVSISASVFRIFSGGAHASSQFRCGLIGMIIFTALGLLVKYLPIPDMVLTYLLLTITVAGFYIMYLYVPADTPGKPISSQVQRRYLRAISFSLLLLGSAIGGLAVIYPLIPISTPLVIASCWGVAWQLLTLTPSGYSIVAKMDLVLKGGGQDEAHHL